MESIQNIHTFLRHHLQDTIGIIGISGGIDSALVATLAVGALGKDRVHGIIMPSSSNSPEEMARAKELATHLDIHTESIAIDPIVEIYTAQASCFDTPTSLGNLKARIRMSLLYGKANSMHGLVLGTGNKTELMLGYCTKYGDAGVDLLPIANLYKKEVRAMAQELGVPQTIINAAPTAGLWEGQTDEAELGITYEQADAILEAIELQHPLDVFDPSFVAIVQEKMIASTHKRVLPPICGI